MSLSASQRVNLIKSITASLEMEQYPIIDLTLKQFGFECRDSWEGSQQYYLIQMLSTGTDEAIVALSGHLGCSVLASEAKIDILPAFWHEGMFRLFISHISPHKAYAAALKLSLKYYGISAFVAHNDIEPTLVWQKEIESALDSCHSLVALLNEGFHDSRWTDQEIGFVMGRGVPVFAVRLGCDPYGFIGRFQAFNGLGKPANLLAKELFEAYLKNSHSRIAVSSSVILQFSSSETYASARERVGYLEQIEKPSNSLIDQLKLSLKINLQIQDATGVPERLKSLFKRWGCT